MITVACVFVKGDYPYSAEYVECLYRAVRRHLDRPFRFVCLTDQPRLFRAPIDTVAVDALPVRHTFWTKLRLFDPSIGFAGRILYLDLDTLPIGDLASVVDFPAPFAGAADCLAPTLVGPPPVLEKGGRAWLPRIQTSVMVWDASNVNPLWTQWHPSLAARYYTDQDWVAYVLGEMPVMPVEWFPRLNRHLSGPGIVHEPPWPAEAKVILVKKEKNHRLAAELPWFDRLWRAA